MTLRDLIVSIDFDDIDIKNLTRVDSAMDGIEDQLKDMGMDIKDASDEFGDMGKDATDALKDIKRDGNKAADAMDELRDDTKDAGKKGSDALDELEDSADDAKDATKKLGKEMRDTGGATDALGGTVKKLIGVVAAFVAVDKIKDLGMSMVEASAAATATNAQFEQVFEGMEDAATKSLSAVGDETHILTGRLKGSFLGMAAFAKTTGMDTAGALALTERATLAAADGAAFYDKSIEEVSESLQSFLKGNFANDAALGISATETTRNAAANKLYGKSFAKLDEAQKQLTLLQMVEDGNKLSGALGQAAREGDGFENVVGNLKQSWTDLLATSGDKLLGPVVDVLKGMTTAIQGFDPTPVMNFLENAVEFGGKAYDILWTLKESIMSLYYDTGEVADLWEALGIPPAIAEDLATVGEILKTAVGGGLDIAKAGFDVLTDVMEWAVDNYDLLAAGALGFAGALAAFKIMTGIKSAFVAFNVTLTAFKTATGLARWATLGFNTALLANPLTWVAVGIGLVIAGGILLYKNWDTITDKAGKLWAATKIVFGGMYDWAKEKIEPITNFFKGLGDKFSEFKDNIMNFKLPGWVTNIGEKIGGAVAKLNGSHATGLSRVPFDGYVAELHKDEAVLTASQSDALRSAGILTDKGSKPDVGVGRGGGSIKTTGGGGGTFAPTYNIIIQGGETSEETAKMVREEVRKENEKFWRQMNMKFA